LSTQEKIKQLEQEIKNTPYNKATAKHIGLLKARIARLKERLEKKSSGSGGTTYSIKKTGDATVLVIGFPSVGKSTLLNAITNAESPVDDYAFTTLEVIPGMMEYRGTKIQVLDVPGIVKGAASGKGMGKQILSVIRNADLLLILLDDLDQLPVVEKELWDAGIRPNEKPPDITLKKKGQGGVSVSSTEQLSEDDKKFFQQLVQEYGIHNADVLLRGKVSFQDFTDFLEGNKKYVPCLKVLNKTDKNPAKTSKVDLAISAKKGTGLKQLKQMIFERLGLTRVFLKKIGENPDMEEPMVLLGKPRVRDLCKRIHKNFLKNFFFARVWGPSAKFDGQRAGLDHSLCDGDVVELHVKR
jgi:hypothetical protein